VHGITAKAKEDIEPDILTTEPMRFAGGANGAGLILDTDRPGTGHDRL
jgi:hypothetical protein